MLKVTETFLAQRDPNAEGCFVLELTMPALDGLKLKRRLAAAGETLPIVFVTAPAAEYRCGCHRSNDWS